MTSRSAATINFQATNHPLGYNTVASNNMGFGSVANSPANFGASLGLVDQGMPTLGNQAAMDTSGAIAGASRSPRRGKAEPRYFYSFISHITV